MSAFESQETVAIGPAIATNPIADQTPIAEIQAAPEPPAEPTFHDLELAPAVLEAIDRSGYAKPTPIQAKIIPHLLAGRDVLAQSQTGSGKTAAFALPLLSQLSPHTRHPQVLVLAPTRELAIQVATSFETYGACVPHLNICCIYGGSSYEPQFAQLRNGAAVVVGTPGRIIDHINKGTLDLSRLKCLVLDEADEMLNMGFLDDVQLILDKTPEQRQIALFSATLPAPIAAIADRYLKSPIKITVKKKTLTADSIRQRAVFVAPRDKVHALCRFLEAEATDGVIVFARTKAATQAIADGLQYAGFSATALNGDMAQSARERTIEQFKAGRLDVLVATDIAARGLDVSRVSHVFNFDPPNDTESYIHRVGRTGRAGRSGEAIIFLAHAQRPKLRLIENATKQKIEIVGLPTRQQIESLRLERFKQSLIDTIANNNLQQLQDLITQFAAETEQPVELIAAAITLQLHAQRPLFFPERERPSRDRSDRERSDRDRSDRDRAPRDRAPRERVSNESGGFERPRRDDAPRRDEAPRERAPRDERPEFTDRPQRSRPQASGDFDEPQHFDRSQSRHYQSPAQITYRIAVGRVDNVEPRHIVGAIANEAGISSQFINDVRIFDDYSTLSLPADVPHELLLLLRRTRVGGKRLLIEAEDGSDRTRPRRGNESSQERRARPPKHRDSSAHARRPAEEPTGHSRKPRAKKPSGQQPFGEFVQKRKFKIAKVKRRGAAR